VLCASVLLPLGPIHKLHGPSNGNNNTHNGGKEMRKHRY
jgi:hypothetical protein